MTGLKPIPARLVADPGARRPLRHAPHRSAGGSDELHHAELGQPMHAFDGSECRAGRGGGGEAGREVHDARRHAERTMPEGTLMIQTNRKRRHRRCRGRARRRRSPKRRNLLLESANFDAATIRRGDDDGASDGGQCPIRKVARSGKHGHRHRPIPQAGDPVAAERRAGEHVERLLSAAEAAVKAIRIDCDFAAKFIGKDN